MYVDFFLQEEELSGKDFSDDIQQIINLDKSGKITSNLHDRPFYRQGTTKLCWAFCMIMNSQSGTKNLSQTQAYMLAILMGIDRNGIQNWNSGETSITYGNGEMIRNKDFENSTFENRIFNALEKTPLILNFGDHVELLVGMAKADGYDTIMKIYDPQTITYINYYSRIKNGIDFAVEPNTDLLSDKTTAIVGASMFVLNLFTLFI